ncbi:MAG: nucleotidyltransferase domain-containing protein [candidate division KSB1 bacterium]|nr:nucleotidyltransferase domain-containing protein [candidate division KSB1 bacterium]MDZ7303358.1 nucleotidyltransferase domain-containing protein [candidate division KSB1 bacterium]MDZ7312324.1 nucleotidyltransferase domain-containing protein [candidate division KSB1 bacterium]
MTKSQLQTLLAELKSDLQKLYGDRLVAVVLYGSYARGKAGSQSDVDIAMVLKDYDRDFIEIDRTSEIVARLSLAYDTTIALIPLRERDWREKHSPFLQNVRCEGVEIK